MAEQAKRTPLHEEFAEKIIEALKTNTAPWQKPWEPGIVNAPFNADSGNVYKGINSINLFMNGFDDPRYMTFKQANNHDMRVKKGEKAHRVVYYVFEEDQPKLDDNGKPVLGEDGQPEMEKVRLERPKVMVSAVFHMTQLQRNDGLEIEPWTSPTPDWNPEERAEKILANCGVEIFHDQQNRAYYSPAKDEIHLPPRSKFKEAARYYATVLHEINHSTGHESRLNRDLSGPFGGEKYAREELRAEIASWMIGNELGIGHDPENHTAYVQSWIKSLEDDPYEIVRACRDAEKIKQVVMGYELTLEQEKTQEIKEAPEVKQEQGFEQWQKELQAIHPNAIFSEKKWEGTFQPIGESADVVRAFNQSGEELGWWCEPYDERSASLSQIHSLEAERVRRKDERKEYEHAQMTAAREQDQGQNPAKEKTFLNVPYVDRNIAKKAGAKWDKEAKLWFAEPGTDLDNLKQFLPEKSPVVKVMMAPQEEFRLALENAGFDLQGKGPVMDGTIQRVAIVGREPGNRDGAYCGYLDGQPAGWMQNFAAGAEKTTWKATGHVLSEEQKQQLKVEAEQRREAREQQQDLVAKQCQEYLKGRYPASSEHAYLQAKGVVSLDILESPSGKELLVPMQDKEGETRSIQYIAEDGSKRFETGGQKKGCFHMIGKPSENSPNVLVCEGYATGASLHQATGLPVAVAFDAGNLKPVAVALKEKFPSSTLTICADNDHSNKFGNVGIEKAKDAALAVNGKVVAPKFTAEEMSRGLKDFNDLHKEHGLKRVQSQIVEQSLGKEKETGKAVGL